MQHVIAQAMTLLLVDKDFSIIDKAAIYVKICWNIDLHRYKLNRAHIKYCIKSLTSSFMFYVLIL